MKFRFTGDRHDALPAASPPEPHTLGTKFMDLPVEIHQHILSEFLKDLDTTFDEIKALRLVCRLFNAIVKARVYSSHIKVFRESNYKHLSSNLRQLLTLLSSKPNEQLQTTKTLSIGHWDWLHGKSGFVPFHGVSAIVSVFMNVGSAVIYYLIVPIINPRDLPRRIVKTTLRAFAKLKLYLPVSQFNLPNVSSVVWQPGTGDPKSIISRIVKLLQQLPRLDELTLVIVETLKRFDHLVDCVSKLHNLRKLSLNFYHADSSGSWSHIPCHPEINAVAKIIAANLNLTHLEVVHSLMADDIKIDLAQMLGHVPTDRPLKLERLHLSHSFPNSAALVPHIRSLTSTDLPDPDILQELLEQRIFPPTMTLRIIDQSTIEYLDHHPRIISLTAFYAGNEFLHASTFLGILSRHSETLTHLGFSHWNFYDCIDQTQNKLALLQCRNLKRLDLYYRSILDTATALELEMETMLSVISRLPDSLTLVVNEAWACEVCSVFCGRSQDPLLRDLARRIVYEPVLLNILL